MSNDLIHQVPCVARGCRAPSYKSHVVCFYHLCWEGAILSVGAVTIIGIAIFGILMIARSV
jgi:hypothetical protein